MIGVTYPTVLFASYQTCKLDSMLKHAPDNHMSLEEAILCLISWSIFLPVIYVMMITTTVEHVTVKMK